MKFAEVPGRGFNTVNAYDGYCYTALKILLRFLEGRFERAGLEIEFVNVEQYLQPDGIRFSILVNGEEI